MTNGLVEVGLILASLVLGGLTSAWLGLGVMVTIGFAWWAFVHRGRLQAMFNNNAVGAMGQVGLGLGMLALGHSLAFVLGRAFATLLGFG